MSEDGWLKQNLMSLYLVHMPSISEQVKYRTPEHHGPSSQHKRLHEEKEVRDKERGLQKKVADLSTQLNKLEKRVTLLKTENEALKKKTAEQAPSEEKIKKLKKRNAELAAIARRLEEKAKQLQQEQHVKKRESLGQESESVLKKSFAKQRARDLAENAQKVVEKEKEVEALKQKCQQLTAQLTKTEQSIIAQTQSPEKEELENIIKRAARERLKLERQVLEPLNQNSEAELQKIKTLEETNQALQKEVERLVITVADTEKLEVEVAQRRIECENLNKEIQESKQRCHTLEGELQEVIEKNTQLTIQNSDLQQRITQLEKVSAECTELKSTLASVQLECDTAKSEVTQLTDKLHTLQDQVRHLQHEVSDKDALERKQKELTQQLTGAQQEITMLQQARQASDVQHRGTITGLQSQLAELERKYQLQAQQNSQLTQDMERIKRQLPVATGKPEGREHINSYRNSPHQENTDSDVENDGLSHRDKDLHRASVDENLNAQEDGDLAGNNNTKTMTEDLLSAMDSSISLKKNPFQVFMAKYHYDPQQFSPNENPDQELSLNIGDYIFVYGDMDEDGFYEGELMDGRRGLVPSNFVEKVPDSELEEFHSNLGLRQHDESGSQAGSHTGSQGQHDLDFNSSDEAQEKFLDHLEGAKSHKSQKSPNHQHHTTQEVEHKKSPAPEKTEQIQATEAPYSGISCPHNLKLERELHNSVLISWVAPSDAVAMEIQSYHVCVNGQLKTSVKATERTKALLERVDLKQAHQVSVRTVTNRGQSPDAACVITVGKDASHTPKELSATSITSTTAVISWLPSNSCYEHVIAVNGQEVLVTSPLCFSVALAGLLADRSYKVTITTCVDDSTVAVHKAASFTFKTLEGGIPDAPLDVQVESGPQEGSLLVTWLPVTITTQGKSNGAVVTGYAVYVDGHKVQDMNSPTGDHAVLSVKDLSHMRSNPQCITIRTVAKDNTESPDSHPATITEDLLQELNNALPSGVDELGDSELSDIQEVDEEDDTPRSQVRLNKHAGVQDVPPRKTSSPRVGASPTSLAKHIQNGPERSPRRVPTTIIKAGQTVAPQVAFRPVQEDNTDRSSDHSGQMAVPHIQITKDSGSGSFSDDVSPEKLHGNQPHHHHPNHPSNQHPHGNQGRHKYSSHEPDVPPQRRPKSVPGKYQGNREGRHGNPDNTEPERSSRPKSAKVSSRSASSSDTPSKKRDYFEKHEIETHEKYGGDPKRVNGSHNKSYDEDSLTSYSALEDNNKVTRHRIQEDMSLSELIDYEDDGGDSLIDSVPELDYDETRVRIFIALFDYNPDFMSPNPDALDEELPFKEGQLIKIFGEKDPDGFFMGEANGRRGLVPCNMVSEVQVDDPEIAAQLLRESNRAASSRLSSRGVSRNDSRATSSRGPSRGDVTRHNGLARPGPFSPRRSPRSSQNGSPGMYNDPSQRRRMVAMYDYDPQELSPNIDMEAELPFRAGDIVWIFGDMDEDGFFYGELNGRRGLFPSNFLQEAPQYDQYDSNRNPRHGDPRQFGPPPEYAGPSMGRGPPGYPPQGPPPMEQRDYPHPGAPHGEVRDPRHVPHGGPRPRSREHQNAVSREGNPALRGQSPHKHGPPPPREGPHREGPRDPHGPVPFRDHPPVNREHPPGPRDPRDMRDPRDSDKFRTRTPDSGGKSEQETEQKEHDSVSETEASGKEVSTTETHVQNNKKTPSVGSSNGAKAATLNSSKVNNKQPGKSPVHKKGGFFSKGKTIWKKISK